MTDETTALAPRSWQQPSTFKEAQDLATYFAKFGGDAIPKAYRNSPGAAMVAISVGEGLQLSPVQSLQRLHVIHGKVGMDATEIRARCLQHPDCRKFKVTDVSDARL